MTKQRKEKKKRKKANEVMNSIYFKQTKNSIYFKQTKKYRSFYTFT